MNRPYRSLSECRRRLDTLTPAEKSTLLGLAQGFCCKEIAISLGLSFKTPERYRSNIYLKLGYNNPVQLTFFCLRLNLIKIPKT